jgi:3-hydroxyisobutyrate dehydrogenase
MKNIGFIGLGNMGSRMALHLIKAGHNVEGFDTDETTVSELSKVGLVKRETLNELVSNKDFIITMLPNGDVVESVVNKILDNLTDGSIIIDCSTIDVNTVVKINSLLSDTGITFLDAPVSGGTIGAENGTLTFMVGGDNESFLKIYPILDLMGSKSVYCGEVGSGQAVKLCNNMILAVTMIGVGEAFNMAKNLNVDLNVLYEVISTATGSCWAINNYCPIAGVGPQSPADNNFIPGFSAKLMSKDLKIAVNAAKDSKSNIKFGEMAEKLYTKMAEGINGNKDFSAIILDEN